MREVEAAQLSPQLHLLAEVVQRVRGLPCVNEVTVVDDAEQDAAEAVVRKIHKSYSVVFSLLT